MLNKPSTPAQSHVATQLARQAAKAVKAWRAADAEGSSPTVHMDRIVALQGEVAFHPAGGGEAAQFQLGALYVLLESAIHDEGQLRAAERLVEQLTRFIETTTGVGRGVFGGYCLPEAPAASAV